jgi:hypothetical protein
MALIMLYMPDGEVIEYTKPTEVDITSGFLTFVNRPEKTPTEGRKVTTSLPFLYEVVKDIPLGH